MHCVLSRPGTGKYLVLPFPTLLKWCTVGEGKENGPVFVRILRKAKEEAVNECEEMCVVSVQV